MMKFIQLFLVVLLLAFPLDGYAQSNVYADVNGDGEVTLADVNAVIDVILGGTVPTPPPDEEHEWIDLGLPSGTLWAACNVGASSPEEYGDYFAWGETTPKDYYGWGNYKWCNGSYTKLIKYCSDSRYGYQGFVDNKTELDLEDDASYVNWGPFWRMPSKEQQDELRAKCTWQWIQRNGVNGYLVTGPNRNTIFFPAAGRLQQDHLNYVGTYGDDWSRTRYSSHPYSADVLGFGADYGFWDYGDRGNGFTVRAVRVSKN